MEIVTSFAFSVNHLTIFVCSSKFSRPYKFFLSENFVEFFRVYTKNSLSPTKNGDVNVGNYLFLKASETFEKSVLIGCAHGKDHSIKSKHASILPDK